MANAQRPVAPLRKLIAAVLGTVATFVTLFGLGMRSWAIVALGVALLVLALALAMVRANGRVWVVGTGHVHTVSEPPTTYAFGRCELHLVIDAPGLPPRSKKVIEPRVPVAKWPSPGQPLPIKVAVDDQRHVRVLWDEVPTHGEAASVVVDPPPEFVRPDPVDDGLLEPERSPWSRPDPGDDLGGPLGTEPLPDDRGPVVVHQRPGGPTIVEGTVVGSPTTAPLPRRAGTPTQRPPIDDPYDLAVEDPVDVPLDAPGDEPTLVEDPVVEDPVDGAAGTETPISGVGATLLVTDLARSVAFYRDLLAFEELDSGETGAVLASGSTRLVLRRISDAAPANRRLVHLNLDVDDLDAAYRRLKDAGVTFSYAPRMVNQGTRLEVWAAAFHDPDGHRVALTQLRERAAG